MWNSRSPSTSTRGLAPPAGRTRTWHDLRSGSSVRPEGALVALTAGHHYTDALPNPEPAPRAGFRRPWGWPPGAASTASTDHTWLRTQVSAECHLRPSVAVLVDRSAVRGFSIILWLSSVGGRGSPWSLSRPPVERAVLDHLCDPWGRVVGWLTFGLDDLSFDDLLSAS
jgi:hypothetical protein